MRKRLQLASMLTADTATATSLSLFASLFLSLTSIAAVSLFLAVFLSFASQRAWAAEGDGRTEMITATDENGRKIYVNEPVSAQKRAAQSEAQSVQPQRSSLVYWSSKDSRWKPVPSAGTASMKAARSAAAEVSQYFRHESQQSANARIVAANARGHQASQDEIDASIVMAAARHNVDPNLVRAVVKVESNFNSNAVSRKGAMGLMQLMPSTARSLNVKNPFDAEQNVDAGVRHLKQLLESYGGDVNLTLAAYNAGSGAVARSAGVPRFAETQNYVRKITNLYYGGFDLSPSGPRHEPVRVQRDARGVLYISNTD